MSIGRMGVKRAGDDDVAPVDRINKEKGPPRFTKFDASKGRDYSEEKIYKASYPTLESDDEKPEPVVVPIKSPAQVAAEKAEDWKK